MSSMPQLKILCQTNIGSTIVPMNPETNEKIVQPKENFFKEIVKFTIIALIVVVPIRAYVAQPFIVSGPSMDPTFDTGQYLIVDQLTYHFKDPQRLDVIVFRFPGDPKVFYIKRIIGLPGDILSVADGKVTVINTQNPQGFAVDDSYVIASHKTSESFKITLGPSEYFVMGDNRGESSDSRTWGPLDTKYIVGRPLLRLLPFNKVSFLPGE